METGLLRIRPRPQVDAARSPVLAGGLFILTMLLVGVVLLNGLIALLGQSFSDCLATEELSQIRARLDFVLENLCIMRPSRRVELEARCRHLYVLVPENLWHELRNVRPVGRQTEHEVLTDDVDVGATLVELKAMVADLAAQVRRLAEKSEPAAGGG